jgi:hypothetical protein
LGLGGAFLNSDKIKARSFLSLTSGKIIYLSFHIVVVNEYKTF